MKRASEMSADELDLSSQSLDWWLAQDKQEAGELLLRKAMVLMGVSKELGADSERGKALKKEAEELLSFANDVQSMPETQQAMAEAHKLLSDLNAKYSQVAVQGQGLADESLKLWSSVSTSKEAQDLVTQGKSLLADWSKYAQSSEGQELLGRGQRMAQGQSGGLIAMIDEHVLNKEGKPVVEKEKLKTMAGQVSDVGKELHKELADDEDVQELIKRAEKDLRSVASQAQDAAHQSILEDKDNPLALQTLSEEQKTTLAIMKGEKYLRELKDSGIGQKLMQQGTAYLASGSLSPSALMGQGTQLMNDERSRQQLINKIKDQALDFLMAYLPTAKVPPVEGEKGQQLHHTCTAPASSPSPLRIADASLCPCWSGRGLGVQAAEHRPVRVQGAEQGRGGGHQRGGRAEHLGHQHLLRHERARVLLQEEHLPQGQRRRQGRGRRLRRQVPHETRPRAARAIQEAHLALRQQEPVQGLALQLAHPRLRSSAQHGPARCLRHSARHRSR